MSREGHPLIFSQISIILSKFRILIFSVLSVVASLFAVSCDEMQVETGITISNRQAVYKAGQETVSISASGEWAWVTARLGDIEPDLRQGQQGCHPRI